MHSQTSTRRLRFGMVLLLALAASGAFVGCAGAGIMLQPGELGCSPYIAMLPPEQLRSPH